MLRLTADRLLGLLGKPGRGGAGLHAPSGSGRQRGFRHPGAAVAVLLAIALLHPGPVRAQSAPPAPFSVNILAPSGRVEACLTEAALLSRVAHYGPQLRRPELTLTLRLGPADSAELQIARGEEQLARRVFERLPTACPERRDAIAVSVVMALGALPVAEVSPEPARAKRVDAPEPGPSKAPRPPKAEPSTPRREAPPLADSSPARPDAGSEPAPVPVDEARDGPAQEPPEAPLSPAVPVEGPPPAAPAAAAPSEPVKRTPESPPAEAPPPAPAPPAVRAAAAATDSDRGPLLAIPLALHGGGRFLLEVAPAPLWAGTFGVQVQLAPRAALDLTGFVSAVGEASLAGGRARASALGGELLGCLSWPWGQASVQACAGASLAGCRVRGRGFAEDYPGETLLWLAGSVRAALVWPLFGPLSLRVLASGHLSAVRPGLVVAGSAATERVWPVGAAFGIDLLWALE